MWFALPGGRAIDVSSVVDLCIDFDAIRPTAEPTTPAHIPLELRVTPGELVGFFTSAWQAATALVTTTGENAVNIPPAGAPRMELYIQNRYPEASGGSRVLRTLDLVDLSVFGRTDTRSVPGPFVKQLNAFQIMKAQTHLFMRPARGWNRLFCRSVRRPDQRCHIISDRLRRHFTRAEGDRHACDGSTIQFAL